MSFRNLSPQRMFERLALEHRPPVRFGDHARGVHTVEGGRAAPGAGVPGGLAGAGAAAAGAHRGVGARRAAQAALDHRRAAGTSPRRSWSTSRATCGKGEKRPGHPLLPRPRPVRQGAGDGQRQLAGAAGEHRPAQLQLRPRHGASRVRHLRHRLDRLRRAQRQPASRTTATRPAAATGATSTTCTPPCSGMTSLSINVTHGKAATDFACTLPFVDAERLGVMGLERRRHHDAVDGPVRRALQGRRDHLLQRPVGGLRHPRHQLLRHAGGAGPVQAGRPAGPAGPARAAAAAGRHRRARHLLPGGHGHGLLPAGARRSTRRPASRDRLELDLSPASTAGAATARSRSSAGPWRSDRKGRPRRSSHHQQRRSGNEHGSRDDPERPGGPFPPTPGSSTCTTAPGEVSGTAAWRKWLPTTTPRTAPTTP